MNQSGANFLITVKYVYVHVIFSTDFIYTCPGCTPVSLHDCLLIELSIRTVLFCCGILRLLLFLPSSPHPHSLPLSLPSFSPLSFPPTLNSLQLLGSTGHLLSSFPLPCLFPSFTPSLLHSLSPPPPSPPLPPATLYSPLLLGRAGHAPTLHPSK